MAWEAVRAAKARVERRFLRLANVVGIGVGYKTVRDRRTDEPAVIVFVERKLPESDLRRQDIVPKRVGDVKTDVVETGKLRALGMPKPEAAVRRRTDRWRPAPGGVSVGHERVSAGTLGAVVRTQGGVRILSNNHVLANSNDAKRGDPVLQPGTADGGGPDDLLARLDAFIPIRWDRKATRAFPGRVLAALRGGPARNTVDAALAVPVRPDAVDPTLLGIGAVRGMAAAHVGDGVRKSGRTTGLTDGTVLGVSATVRVDYDGRTATFADQIVASGMSRPGDSGSVVVDAGNRAVGLLFAGGESATILNPIDRVAAALGFAL